MYVYLCPRNEYKSVYCIQRVAVLINKHADIIVYANTAAATIHRRVSRPRQRRLTCNSKSLTVRRLLRRRLVDTLRTTLL